MTTNEAPLDLDPWLLRYGLSLAALPATPQVQGTARLIGSLTRTWSLEQRRAWGLYALLINVVDALLDCPAPEPTDLAAVEALATSTALPPQHRLSYLNQAAAEAWPLTPETIPTAAVASFAAAQVRQRQPALAWQPYLVDRITAQGVPLMFATAAALIEPTAPALEQRINRAGTITSLSNDLASYERELAEGIAITANARGVLAQITALDPMHPALTRLIEAEITAARQELVALLRPTAPLDHLIARIVAIIDRPL